MLFLEVPAGQGEYTWIDYNNDGIQQLNEFEVALFQDQAKYIRIFTPTNEFVKANYNTFNYTVGLNPRSIINLTDARRFMKLLANVNLQSSLQLNKKGNSQGHRTIQSLQSSFERYFADHTELYFYQYIFL